MVIRDLGLLDGQPVAKGSMSSACAPECFRKGIVDRDWNGRVDLLRILSKITQDFE